MVDAAETKPNKENDDGQRFPLVLLTYLEVDFLEYELDVVLIFDEKHFAVAPML